MPKQKKDVKKTEWPIMEHYVMIQKPKFELVENLDHHFNI